MPKKGFTPEQIVAKLCQIEVLVRRGKTVPLGCKAGIPAKPQRFPDRPRTVRHHPGIAFTLDRSNREFAASNKLRALETTQEKISCALQHFQSYRGLRQHAGEFDCADHRREDRKERRFLVRTCATRHKG
jgi:hypothetical protein